MKNALIIAATLIVPAILVGCGSEVRSGREIAKELQPPGGSPEMDLRHEDTERQLNSQHCEAASILVSAAQRTNEQHGHHLTSKTISAQQGAVQCSAEQSGSGMKKQSEPQLIGPPEVEQGQEDVRFIGPPVVEQGQEDVRLIGPPEVEQGQEDVRLIGPPEVEQGQEDVRLIGPPEAL